MSKNRETLFKSIMHLSAAQKQIAATSNMASEAFSSAAIVFDTEKFKLGSWRKTPSSRVLFGSLPKHKLSNRFSGQLKAILRGRAAITVKPNPFPKHLRKQAVRAFRNDAVIWNTPGHGLEYFQSIYSQNK